MRRTLLLALLVTIACADEPVTAPESPAPEAAIVATFDSSSVIAGQNHSCALTAAGVAYCWGANDLSQLGSPLSAACDSGPCATMPQPVSGAHTFVQLAAGFSHTCGLTEEGITWCWGDGFLGDVGEWTTSATPVRVQQGRIRFVSITAGDVFTCGLATTGKIWCWGVNEYGQLGIGTTDFSPLPTRVMGTRSYVAIDAGGQTICAIATNGRAFCWGQGSSGQIGDGNATAEVTLPTAVDGQRAYQDIDVGYLHVCSVAETGRVYCWGLNFQGELGVPRDGFEPVKSPIRALAGSDYVDVAVGLWHTCGLRSTGRIWCWGSAGDELGQLGRGDSMIVAPDSLSPARVAGTATYTGLDAGRDHTCAVASTGRVQCWGGNYYGQGGRVPELRRCWEQACLVVPMTVSSTLVFGATAADFGRRGIRD